MNRMSHTERANQRTAAAAAVRSGSTPAEVSRQTGKSMTWVNVACGEHGVTLPNCDTHRAQQRKAAADAVASGTPPGIVARQVGKSLEWVRTACHIHQVDLPIQRAVQTMDILAAILRAPQSTTQTAIAQQFSTSRQRVNQVLKSAQAANIPGLDRW